MINNSTDICNANKSLKKKPDPLHMALELQVLVWDRYKPYVMEFTKTLVINVVPITQNVEKTKHVYHWFVSLI